MRLESRDPSMKSQVQPERVKEGVPHLCGSTAAAGKVRQGRGRGDAVPHVMLWLTSATPDPSC